MKKLLLITLTVLALPAANLRAVLWNVREALEYAKQLNATEPQLKKISDNLKLILNGMGRFDEEAGQAIINDILDIDALSPSQQVQQAEQERREQEQRVEQEREQEWQANMLMTNIYLGVLQTLENEHASLELANQLIENDNDEQASLTLAKQLQEEETGL